MQVGLREQRSTLQEIREVLQTVELQQQIKQATGPNQIIRLIMAAGLKRGYCFSRENVIEVLLQVDRQDLTPEERLVSSSNPFH